MQASFFVPLEVKDWVVSRKKKRYFRCSALGLPGARVVGVTVAGETLVDKDAYRVKRGRLYWTGGVPPDDLYVQLELKSRLLSWKAAFLGMALALIAGGICAQQPILRSALSHTTQIVNAMIPASMAAER